MANDFITPEEAAKRLTKALNNAAKENGIPREKEAEFACDVLGGLFMGPSTTED